MKEFVIKSGILNRPRKLILTPDYLEWENGNLKGEEFTRLEKSFIADFKHTVNAIEWYKFTVGRKYRIIFKDKTNKELKISFSSYFGLYKENHSHYSEIIENIWKFYHSDIVDKHLDIFYNKQELNIQGIKLNSEGIELRNQNRIPWTKVSIKNYYSYFAVYHEDTPNLHARIGYYEYESETLWSVLKTILKEREMNA